jgi:hypothetical protein
MVTFIATVRPQSQKPPMAHPPGDLAITEMRSAARRLSRAIRRSRRGRLSWDGGRLIVRDGEGPSPGRLACAVPSLASVTARCSTVARLAFSGRVLAHGRVPFRSRGVGTLANASAPMLRMLP